MRVLATLFVLLQVSLLAGAIAQRPVFEVNFERKRATAAFVKHDQLELVKKAGVGGSTALRATYIPSKQGSERIVVRESIKPGFEYTLNYDVKFEKDFDFTHGGKLHGLGPVTPITGGKAVKPDGWSSRVNFAVGGRIKTYNYHQNQSGKYGEGGKVKDKSFRFPKGKWVAVSLHVRVNEDPQKKTGFSKLYVNGKLIETRDKVQWRAKGGKDTMINQFLFSTFHGGSTDKWTPRDEKGRWKKVHALFDNIAVYPGERIRRAVGK